jgi:predicted nuclease of restriction endonuclease-like (RecB) superfamily
MNNIIQNSNYADLLKNIKERITSARIAASSHVNRELIMLYWDIGGFIIAKQKSEGWGKSVVEQLSKDIQKGLPAVTGYSPDNLWKMRQFYAEYTDAKFIQQAVRELKNIPKHLLNQHVTNLLQPVTDLMVSNKHLESEGVINLLQLVRELTYDQRVSLIRALASLIPWGQNILIFTKIKDVRERLYYILATATYGWSRAVLLNQLKSKAYKRLLVEEKNNNFTETLPEYLAEQADEAMKSSYNLEFLGINKLIHERELENRLIAKLKEFMLELGYGFCFIGSQYRLVLQNKEYFIDLLFYHRFLKSLVAIDLKVTEFKPEYAGKMDFYLNLLNEKEKAADDNPAIGIILCAEQNNLEVEFSLMSKNNPIGVAEYQLFKTLPEEFKGKLPSIEEIAKMTRQITQTEAK